MWEHSNHGTPAEIKRPARVTAPQQCPSLGMRAHRGRGGIKGKEIGPSYSYKTIVHYKSNSWRRFRTDGGNSAAEEQTGQGPRNNRESDHSSQQMPIRFHSHGPQHKQLRTRQDETRRSGTVLYCVVLVTISSKGVKL